MTDTSAPSSHGCAADAARAAPPCAGWIWHSDHGSQYDSLALDAQARAAGIAERWVRRAIAATRDRRELLRDARERTLPRPLVTDQGRDARRYLEYVEVYSTAAASLLDRDALSRRHEDCSLRNSAHPLAPHRPTPITAHRSSITRPTKRANSTDPCNVSAPTRGKTPPARHVGPRCHTGWATTTSGAPTARRATAFPHPRAGGHRARRKKRERDHNRGGSGSTRTHSDRRRPRGQYKFDRRRGVSLITRRPTRCGARPRRDGRRAGSRRGGSPAGPELPAADTGVDRRVCEALEPGWGQARSRRRGWRIRRSAIQSAAAARESRAGGARSAATSGRRTTCCTWTPRATRASRGPATRTATAASGGRKRR